MPSEKTIQFTDKSGNYLYPKIRTANAINDGHFLQVSDSGTVGQTLVWTSQGPKWEDVSYSSDSITQLRYQNFTSEDVSDGKVTFPQLNIPVGVETSSGNYYPIQKGSVQLGLDNVAIELAPYLAYEDTPYVTGTWRVWFSGGLDTGWIQRPNNGIITLTIGAGGDFQDVPQALAYVRACGPHKTNLFLKRFKADGVTQAEYTVSSADLGVLHVNIRSQNESDSQDLPLLTGTLAVRYGYNVQLKNVQVAGSIQVIDNSHIDITSCLIDGSATTQNISSVVSTARCGTAVITDTVIKGGLSAGKTLVGIAAAQGGVVFVRQSTIDNCSVGLRADHAGYIYAPAARVEITNTTTVSSPAVNTTGNGNAYVER